MVALLLSSIKPFDAMTPLNCHRSKLVQRRVSSLADADRLFADVTINHHEGE
jgi:hypothetical protein